MSDETTKCSSYSGEWVELLVRYNRIELTGIRMKLEAAGIPSRADGDTAVDMWGQTDGIGALSLMVPADSVDAAQELLAQSAYDWDNCHHCGESLLPEKKCARCGWLDKLSTRVPKSINAPLKRRHFVKWFVAVILSVLVLYVVDVGAPERAVYAKVVRVVADNAGDDTPPGNRFVVRFPNGQMAVIRRGYWPWPFPRQGDVVKAIFAEGKLSKWRYGFRLQPCTPGECVL